MRSTCCKAFCLNAVPWLLCFGAALIPQKKLFGTILPPWKIFESGGNGDAGPSECLILKSPNVACRGAVGEICPCVRIWAQSCLTLFSRAVDHFSLVIALAISSSLMALRAAAKLVQEVNGPLASFLSISGIPSNMANGAAQLGSSAKTERVRILLAYWTCPVISMPLTITIFPMFSFNRISDHNFVHLCSTIWAVAACFGHHTLKAASSLVQSPFVPGLMMSSSSNQVSATEFVAKPFPSLLALKVADDISLNVFMMDFR